LTGCDSISVWVCFVIIRFCLFHQVRVQVLKFHWHWLWNSQHHARCKPLLSTDEWCHSVMTQNKMHLLDALLKLLCKVEIKKFKNVNGGHPKLWQIVCCCTSHSIQNFFLQNYNFL